MKGPKVISKRSASPLEAPKTLQISDRKKKSTSTAQLRSAYKKGIKQFETYGKTQKKKSSNNYLKELLKNNGDSTNKYRIVTQPVEDRLLYLGNNQYGNASGAVKQSGSRKKNQLYQPEYADRYLKLNIRTSNHSKQKLKTGDSFHKIETCRNCEKYREQLDYFKKQINKLCMDKVLWKNGQLHLQDIRDSFKFKTFDEQVGRKSVFNKALQKQITEIKKHTYDLMKDIESLSTIDYPKMLSLKVFKYDPFYSQSPSHQQQELKSLLGQLRNSMQGKVIQQDLENLYQNNQENEYSKKIMRNMKSRLNFYLRQNLELKLKKQILQRSEQITSESEDYLKKIIQEVLLSYSESILSSSSY